MTLLRPVLAQRPGVLIGWIALLSTIVMLAILATALFSGPGPVEPFDLGLDQVPLPF